MDGCRHASFQTAQAKIDVVIYGAGIVVSEAAKCFEPCAVDREKRRRDADDRPRRRQWP
jgi:hypothetical protein